MEDPGSCDRQGKETKFIMLIKEEILSLFKNCIIVYVENFKNLQINYRINTSV